METLPAPPGLATGQTSPQGGSGGAALGGPKKPTPAVMRWICPRRSGPKWQDNQWNRPIPRTQMTTDTRRLMRLGAVASKERSVKRLPVSIAKLPKRDLSRVRQRVGQRIWRALRGLEPYEGKLSSTVLRGAWTGNRPRLPGGSRPVRGGGRSGRQPVRGQRLACLGRRPGSAVSTKTPVNSKEEGPSTSRPLTGVRLRLAKSGRRLELKLYLALAPSRHVSALRNLMLVLSMV